MATFKYVAKDMASKVQNGTMDADDRNELVRKLKNQGLYLVEYKDITKQAMNQYRLKYKELANYSREVGTMLASGLSLIRTFSIMVRREDNKKIKKIYENIYVKLQQGYTLSYAMEAQGGTSKIKDKQTRYFIEVIQNMYKGNYDKLHRRIKMNRNNFIYAAIITGSIDLIKDLPEGFRSERRNEGKLEEKRSTLKEQLIIKLGAVSNRLEEQLTNASLEKLNVLTRNIFDITSEEDVLRIIH